MEADREKAQLLEEGNAKSAYLTYLRNSVSSVNSLLQATDSPPRKFPDDAGVDLAHEALGHSPCHSDAGGQRRRRREESERAKRQLYLVSVICFVFIIGEAVGGILAHSLAIMTDVAHLLTDFASFSISLLSLWLADRPTSKRMTFGWYRAEILGALLSIFSIWVVTGVLVYLAACRMISRDFAIEGTAMLATSACAVIVNIIMAVLLARGHHSSGPSGDSEAPPAVPLHLHGHSHLQSHSNPSIRAAFIHALGDLLQSIGVLVAACIIFFKPEYKLVDPICTFIFSLFVLVTTITILRDVLQVLMEGVPLGERFDDVQGSLLSMPGVQAVHDLHLWSLTSGRRAASAHLVTGPGEPAMQPLLQEATRRLRELHGFHEVTLQLEPYNATMATCPDCKEPHS
ncbi:proton-coupled zinc antiporter SLC30A2-like [Petromyzon marinus]|uniref:proton-coupled zinc antiporter SLC30A2-like n=1 Tax=Petromyzon marinus TaxID=7757 RepID=UPI003F70B00C